MKTFSTNALWELCNKENFFTCGTQEQYNKLFEANDNGCSIEELATMIWICSEDVSRDEIVQKLSELPNRFDRKEGNVKNEQEV